MCYPLYSCILESIIKQSYFIKFLVKENINNLIGNCCTLFKLTMVEQIIHILPNLKAFSLHNFVSLSSNCKKLYSLFFHQIVIFVFYMVYSSLGHLIIKGTTKTFV